AATGESVRTQFVAYDSLGNEVVVNLTMSLLSKNSTGGTTWQYLVDSPDDEDLSTSMGSGTISFDNQGQLIDTDPISVSMERNAVGAESPLIFEIRLAAGNAGVTALATNSQLLPAQVDGLPPGTLESFAIARDGTVVGTFSNGAVRPLARLALANFVNAAGLVDAGANLFQEGINSGVAAIIPAGSASVGDVIEGSLELSNVDLSQEFINLITASTAFSASSRVITTTEQLFQQLLALGR
ncbi:MAG: flagellar hook-basal body complex protein, partial [Phycisphaerales bacterium]